MIIAVEGLACVGKTTLIQDLARKLDAACCIAEVLPQALGVCCRHSAHFASVYYVNDLLKSDAAAAVSQAGQVAILDRYYLSTITHRLALEKVAAPKLAYAALELLRGFYPAVARPDLWVYVVGDPQAAWERHAALRKLDELSQWSTQEGTRRIHAAMEACFASSAVEGTACIRVRSAPCIDIRPVLERVQAWTAARLL